MKQREKTLDIALLIGAAIAVIIAMTTGFVKNCEEMQEKAFRLHILANSDSAADQQIKYEVRDYILSDLSCIFDSCDTKDETKALAERNIGFITERINDYLKLDGCEYRAVCTVEKCSFGTRKYGDYTLPAGEYDALKITLGKGEGNNWWCVLFPSVCSRFAMQDTEALYREAGFTPEQYRLITHTDTVQYQVRFRLLEILEALKDSGRTLWKGWDLE